MLSAILAVSLPVDFRWPKTQTMWKHAAPTREGCCRAMFLPSNAHRVRFSRLWRPTGYGR
jgi:hypothetical protein